MEVVEEVVVKPEEEDAVDREITDTDEKERECGTRNRRAEQEIAEGKHYHSCSRCSSLSCYQRQAPECCGRKTRSW